jgi:hypothetical protein
MKQRFSGEQISRIIDQALVFQCACPAQLATTILELRDLFDYQLKCRDGRDGTGGRVHDAIAQATLDAHGRMEDCLDEVLALEGWDRATLTMPAGLRKRPVKSI